MKLKDLRRLARAGDLERLGALWPAGMDTNDILPAVAAGPGRSFTEYRALLRALGVPRKPKWSSHGLCPDIMPVPMYEAMAPYISSYVPQVSAHHFATVEMLIAYERLAAIQAPPRAVVPTLLDYFWEKCLRAPTGGVVATASHAPALVVRRWAPALHGLVGLDTRPVVAALLAVRRPAVGAQRLAAALVDAQSRRPCGLRVPHT